MEEKRKTRLMEVLERGIEVLDVAPYYLNAVVGYGYIGYVVPCEAEKGKQFNLILRVCNDEAMFKGPTITMTIFSIFRYEPDGKRKNIASPLIGREVILTPISSEGVINNYYFITGTFKLKNEPP